MRQGENRVNHNKKQNKKKSSAGECVLATGKRVKLNVDRIHTVHRYESASAEARARN